MTIYDFNSVSSVYPYYTGSSRVTKKVTTSRKYDEKGNLTEETVVEETFTDSPTYAPYQPPYIYTRAQSGQAVGDVLSYNVD